MFNRESYVRLIRDLQAAGYRFAPFDDYQNVGCVILRHDIDFSISDAVELAKLENDLGISATYFVLLTSSFYNPLSPGSLSLVRELIDLGATVGLHFDPEAHADVDSGFLKEKAIFEGAYRFPLKIVSMHRPRAFLDENDRKLEGVRHTYENEFFHELAYISDSGGSFRFGEPRESEAFRMGKSIHLNLHPIWWVREGSDPSAKLRNWQREHFEALNNDVAQNCRTFDGIPAWAS